MQKILVAIAATVALSIAAPTWAAVIVQGESEDFGAPMQGFDPSIGRLEAVHLTINVIKTRGWRAELPAGLTPNLTVGWSVDGTWKGPVYLPLTGAGNSTFNLTHNAFTGKDEGYFTVTAYAHGEFDLDPSNFINRPGGVFYDGFDPGFFDTIGADTTFTVRPGGTTLSRIAKQCSGSYIAFGEDDCGTAFYRLTYYYTPTAQINAAPEPATWALMVLGFGGVGYSLRRRRVGRSAANPA